MTWRKREIMEMAREAGICTWLKPPSDVVERIEAFAALVRADERTKTWTQEHWTEYERSIAAAEREACADLLEYGYIDDEGHHLQYAKELRARGQA